MIDLIVDLMQFSNGSTIYWDTPYFKLNVCSFDFANRIGLGLAHLIARNSGQRLTAIIHSEVIQNNGVQKTSHSPFR